MIIVATVEKIAAFWFGILPRFQSPSRGVGCVKSFLSSRFLMDKNVMFCSHSGVTGDGPFNSVANLGTLLLINIRVE